MLKEQTRLNSFKHVSVNEGAGRRVTLLRAFCSEPGCDEAGEVRLRHGKLTLTPEHAEANFRKKGWELGDRGDGRRDKDRCPSCVKREVELRREEARRRREREKQLELIPTVLRHEELTEEQHQEHTNEERDFVLQFIEAHLKPKNEELDIRRYQTGWSDAKVLAELQDAYPDLKLQTIRELRYQNFGFARRMRQDDEAPPPAPPPADLQALVETLQAKIAQLEKNDAVSRAVVRQLTDRVHDLQASVEEMEEHFEGARPAPAPADPSFQLMAPPTEPMLIDLAPNSEDSPPLHFASPPAEENPVTSDRAFAILTGYLNYGEAELYDQFDSYFDELRTLLPPAQEPMKLYRVLRLSAADIGQLEEPDGLVLPPHRYSSWTSHYDIAERRGARTRRGKMSIIIEQEFAPEDILVDLVEFYEANGLKDRPEFAAVQRNAEVLVEHDPHVTILPDMVVQLIKPKK